MPSVDVEALRDRLPQDLVDRDIWLMWDSSSDTPRRPHWLGDFGISWSDPGEWHSFEEAVEHVNDQEGWGLGYVNARDNPDYPKGLITTLDLDGCLTDGDELTDWLPSLEPFAERDVYIERSPSGNGIHIPIIGLDVPEWWRDGHLSDDEHEGVEVLSHKFCTVTGDTTFGSGENLAEPGTWLRKWLADAYKAVHGQLPQSDVSAKANAQSHGSESDLSNDQIRAALDHVDPDCSYPDWRDIGYALVDHYGAGKAAEQEFRRWSRSGSKYDEGEAERYIEDITNNADPDGGITVGTLIHRAKQGGWTPPWQKTATPDGGAASSSDAAEGEAAEPETDEEPDEWVQHPAAVKIREHLNDLQNSDRPLKAQVIAYEAAEALGETMPLATMRDNEEIWAWDSDTGVWQPNGDQVVRRMCELGLEDWYKNQIKNETLERVKTRTFIERARFGAPERTIAVRNGLLDLETRDLRDLKPSDRAIRRLPVKYDPDQDCSRFTEFLEEVVPEEDDRMALQEFVGYCLLQGELPIHRALMIVGDGANGKSTFLSVVENLLGGEQCGSAIKEAENNVVNHSLHDLAAEGFCKADLYGKLANIDPDLHPAELGANNDFKSLVGGDTVMAQQKYQDPFKFQQTAKLLFGANEVPDVQNSDTAFYRRWLIVQFPTWIPPADRDPQLKDRLTEPVELSGILNWALDGLDRLLEQGEFTGEGDVVEKEEMWTSWGDSISRFVSDCIEDKNDGDDKASTGQMHEVFTRFCQDHDLDPVSQQKLTSDLKNQNIGNYGKVTVDGSRQRGFMDFSWSDDAPPVPSPSNASSESDDGQSTLGGE